MRIGTGFDIHRFQTGRDFILGGVKIPFKMGLSGHSDADVLLHAISDAILGALGKPDIGYYFPDTDPAIKNIDSREIMGKSLQIMEGEGFCIKNIDAVIICEKPRLIDMMPAIKKSVSSMAGIKPQNIGLKAKTFEGLGEIGRGEACACHVVLLITEQEEK